MTRKLKSIGLSLLLIVSMIGGVAALAGSASAAPSGFVSVTDAQVYSDLPEQTPMGQHAQAISEAGVMSSAHADSLEVLVTNPGRATNYSETGTVFGSGPIAIVITDDQHSDGRTVALPAAEIQDALDYQPELARGTHEDGSPWSSKIEYEDGWMLVEVPHFSDNVVTFGGKVQVGDTFASGSTVSWTVSDMDATSDLTVNMTGARNSEVDTVSGTLNSGTISTNIAGTVDPPETTLSMAGDGFGSRWNNQTFTSVSDGHSGSVTVDGSLSDTDIAANPTVEVTGHSNSEWDNVTATGLSDGESIPIDAAGTSLEGPSENGLPTVAFDGIETTSSASRSGTGNESGLDFSNVEVGGNLPPNNELLEVTGNRDSSGFSTWKGSGSTGTYSETFENPPKTVNELTASASVNNNGNSGSGTVRFYKNGNQIWSTSLSVASDYGSDDSSSTTGSWSFTSSDTLTIEVDISDDTNGANWYGTAYGSPPQDVTMDVGGTQYNLGDFTDGETKTRSVTLSEGTNSVSFTESNRAPADVTLSWDSVTGTEDPSLDVDGDGVDEVTHTGILTSGETATYELSSLSPGDDTATVGLADGTVDASVALKEVSNTQDPGITLNGVTKSYSGTLSEGETAELSYDPSVLDADGSTNSFDFSMATLSADAPPMEADYSVHVNDVDAVKDPSVDIDGDGTSEASYNGLLTSGQYHNTTIDPSLDDDTWEVSAAGNPVSITADITERVDTQDPGVGLNVGTENEAWANHTGTLVDGETVTYTIDKSALQEGENTITVEMPELSADAPPRQVDVQAHHDAQDDQRVSYEAEKYSERYNVSKTFASDRTDPTLTIPFADEAVAIRQAEYRVNGGDWQTTTDWVVENTTGTVHLPEVQANDTIEVRANASRVTVQNGEIKVLEPTAIGSDLDSKIEVTSAQGSEELVLGIGSSPDAHMAHTTYEESWTADPYGVISTNGHEFHLPDAAAGSIFRVKTTPMEISPRSNDVVYEVPDDSDSLEPKIKLSPGSTSGDTVDLTFTDAADGKTYDLMSLTFGTVRDSGTASSPLTLTDDDDDEILQFQVEDDGGSTDDTSGTGFWQDQVSVQSVQEAAPVVDPRFIALLMLAIVGIAIFYTEEDDELDDKPVHQRKLVWFGVGMSFLFGLLFLDPRAFTGPLQNALDATLPIAGILGVIAILVSVVMWWRSRQAEAESPDTVLQFNGKTIGGTDDPSEDDKGGGWL